MKSVVEDWNDYVKRRERWALVNEKGEVIETFHNNATAMQWKWKMQKERLEKLKIVPIEPTKEVKDDKRRK